MKIEILENKSVEKTINGKDGKTYTFNEQEAYLHDQTNKYPKKFKISIASGSRPFDVGIYSIDPSSIYVDRYGSLCFARNIKLVKYTSG